MKDKLLLLPDNPGCYLMKDKTGKVIYVGKAKNLRKRVKSYFIGSHNAKTTLLVSNIADFSYIITKSEVESFILELNLIKQYTPRFNIKLMDDKTYPYILITDEVHPRILVVRRTGLKGTLFGPYPDVPKARESVKIINMLYPLRKCRNIPSKACLYYHINQCLAPCINKSINKSNYTEYIKKISSFLKGDTKEVIGLLTSKMNEHSEKLEFEAAKECHDKILSITKTVEKQLISLNDHIDRDVINFYSNDEYISFYVFYMRNGKIVSNNELIQELYTNLEDIFINYLLIHYENHELPQELVINEVGNLDILQELLKTNIIIPKIGDKKKILDLAYDNAKLALENKIRLENLQNSKLDVLAEIEKITGVYPSIIESFDNSHTNGENLVSAMVLFRNGKPSKKEYRKFTIKSFTGNDDYKAMKEVLYRRYYRLLIEDKGLPDLIVIDGGKGQITASNEIFDELNLNIKAIGLKKNEFHKTESIIYNNQEIKLDKHSNLYRFLSSIQEEVHRFAITFHQSVRNKGLYSSRFDSIKGIGPKTKEKLFTKFKTIDNIKNASFEDMKELGISKKVFDLIKENIT